MAEVDALLAVWRQGDFVLKADFPMLHLADLAAPGTPEAERLASEQGEGGLGVVAADTPGFAVTSQTCEIVRSCGNRPYVEVCPLIELPEKEMGLVRSGRRSQFLSLPRLEPAHFAVDLDRPMTMEKAALVQLQDERHSGVTTEAEIRTVADVLGRKRGRAAFPDDFVLLMTPLQKRVVEKHSKNTAEGRFLREVQEIRARAVPSWSSTQIQLTFMFIFDGLTGIPADAGVQIEMLLKLVILSDPYVDLRGSAVVLEDISAATYLGSDRLDFDHLSPAVEAVPGASGLA